jgi:hypothetical protein
MSGSVPFYVKPEPLNSEAMKTLGMVAVTHPFLFAKKTNAVPVAVTEFNLAGLRMPIIFSGDDYLPLAVMGVRPDENLFVKDDGYFDVDVYVPAFIRRYPFVLARETGTERMIVCIDRSAEAVAENGETPLFVNGEPSEFTKQAIGFCTDYETETQKTVNFLSEMKRLDLFEVKQATFAPAPVVVTGPPPEPVLLAEFFAISEEKLNALPAEELMTLRETGALHQIYAHLSSLQNWQKLAHVALMRDHQRVVGNA